MKKGDDQIKALRSNDKTSAYRDANNESLTNIRFVRLISFTIRAILMHIFGVQNVRQPKRKCINRRIVKRKSRNRADEAIAEFSFSFKILIKLFGSLLCHFPNWYYCIVHGTHGVQTHKNGPNMHTKSVVETRKERNKQKKIIHTDIHRHTHVYV